jgi:hypothetical protein
MTSFLLLEIHMQQKIQHKMDMQWVIKVKLFCACHGGIGRNGGIVLLILNLSVRLS